jgi:hypothetical protein
LTAFVAALSSTSLLPNLTALIQAVGTLQSILSGVLASLGLVPVTLPGSGS